MTVGKDVSSLFPDVAQCIQTGNVELKKLVYLYIINYAKSQVTFALRPFDCVAPPHSHALPAAAGECASSGQYLREGRQRSEPSDPRPGREDYGLHSRRPDYGVSG